MHLLLLLALLSSQDGSAKAAPPSAPAPAPAPVAKSEVAPSVNLDSPRDQALVVAVLGLGFGVVSAFAFEAGVGAEGQLVASKHSNVDADSLLNERTISAWVAYPTAVLGVAGIGTGVVMLALAPNEGGAP
ncbi:MAG TPA: hypothetical protein VGO62_13950 [Myxococcota bacterium]|jgi:hypothetical protein